MSWESLWASLIDEPMVRRHECEMQIRSYSVPAPRPSVRTLISMIRSFTV